MRRSNLAGASRLSLPKLRRPADRLPSARKCYQSADAGSRIGLALLFAIQLLRTPRDIAVNGWSGAACGQAASADQKR